MYSNSIGKILEKNLLNCVPGFVMKSALLTLRSKNVTLKYERRTKTH